MVDDLLLACGNCEKAEPLVRLFQAAVGIRVVCGFPSAASVPTSSLSLSFFPACFSSLGNDSAFSSKNFASGGSRSHANACARPVPVAPRHFFRGQLFATPFQPSRRGDRFVIVFLPGSAWTGWVSDGGDKTRPRSPDRRRCW